MSVRDIQSTELRVPLSYQARQIKLAGLGWICVTFARLIFIRPGDGSASARGAGSRIVGPMRKSRFHKGEPRKPEEKLPKNQCTGRLRCGVSLRKQKRRVCYGKRSAPVAHEHAHRGAVRGRAVDRADHARGQLLHGWSSSSKFGPEYEVTTPTTGPRSIIAEDERIELV